MRLWHLRVKALEPYTTGEGTLTCCCCFVLVVYITIISGDHHRCRILCLVCYQQNPHQESGKHETNPHIHTRRAIAFDMRKHISWTLSFLVRWQMPLFSVCLFFVIRLFIIHLMWSFFCVYLPAKSLPEHIGRWAEAFIYRLTMIVWKKNASTTTTICANVLPTDTQVLSAFRRSN